MSRTSAGALSPACRNRRSPGTRSADETRRLSPARTTVASVVSRRESASMACSALASWRKPTTALISTTPRMTAASTGPLSTAVTTPGHNQDIHQRLVELQKEPEDGSARLLCADDVWTEVPLAALDLELIQAARPVGIQEVEDLFGREMVPVVPQEAFHVSPRPGNKDSDSRQAWHHTPERCVIPRGKSRFSGHRGPQGRLRPRGPWGKAARR